MTMLIPARATLSVKIEKVLPLGLLVRLRDGRQGLIRQRELSWQQTGLIDWQQRYKCGQMVDAVILGPDSSDRLELSVRLAHSDPWQRVQDRYHSGQVVEGSVAGFTPDGAFIDIEPGVTGFLPKSHLPAWVTQPIDELLWVGDHIKAVIHQINFQSREVSLDLRDVDRVRWQQGKTTPQDSAEDRTRRSEHLRVIEKEPARTPLQVLADQPPRTILLIEDDTVQNQAITRWLRSAGQHVETVQSGEKALEVLNQIHPEILFTDVGLPGLDGIALAQGVRTDHPEIRCAIMTDWATVLGRCDEIAALEKQGVTLLLKPLLPEELIPVFDTHNQVASEPVDSPLSTDGLPLSAPQVQAASQQVKHSSSSGQQLRKLLDELRAITTATRAILFALDRQRRQIEIVATSGKGELKYSALMGLIYSPVRDAAEDGKVVSIEDTQQSERYAHYLLPLLSFRSCIGVPVRAATEQSYALFLFHSHPGFTGTIIENTAQAGAIAIAAALERETLLKQVVELQKVSLMGHLSRAMIHETNHRLNPLVFIMSDLKQQWGKLLSTVDHYLAPDIEQIRCEVQGTDTLLSQVHKNIENLIRMTRMFGRLTVQDQLQLIRVESVIERCIDLMRDTADRAAIKLELQPPAHLCVTRAKETQVQQIFLNLLINAIQQIALSRGKKGGQVQIRIDTQAINERQFICMVIEDNGPGIHHRLWEHIFSLGVTTRKEEGSGLGLYIARQLSEEMEGRVYVKESKMMWGTQFALELPVQF